MCGSLSKIIFSISIAFRISRMQSTDINLNNFMVDPGETHIRTFPFHAVAQCSWSSEVWVSCAYHTVETAHASLMNFFGWWNKRITRVYATNNSHANITEIPYVEFLWWCVFILKLNSFPPLVLDSFHKILPSQQNLRISQCLSQQQDVKLL